jgi:hypothetical protein
VQDDGSIEGDILIFVYCESLKMVVVSFSKRKNEYNIKFKFG